MRLQDISISNLRRRKAKVIFLILVLAVSTVVTLPAAHADGGSGGG